MERCHGGRDEFSLQERHLRTDKVAQGKEGNWLKWVYAKKQGSLKDNIVSYKARLVAKVYAQREDNDYNEVFSLIIKHS